MHRADINCEIKLNKFCAYLQATHSEYLTTCQSGEIAGVKKLVERISRVITYMHPVSNRNYHEKCNEFDIVDKESRFVFIIVLFF